MELTQDVLGCEGALETWCVPEWKGAFEGECEEQAQYVPDWGHALQGECEELAQDVLGCVCSQDVLGCVCALETWYVEPAQIVPER